MCPSVFGVCFWHLLTTAASRDVGSMLNCSGDGWVVSTRRLFESFVCRLYLAGTVPGFHGGGVLFASQKLLERHRLRWKMSRIHRWAPRPGTAGSASLGPPRLALTHA